MWKCVEKYCKFRTKSRSIIFITNKKSQITTEKWCNEVSSELKIRSNKRKKQKKENGQQILSSAPSLRLEILLCLLPIFFWLPFQLRVFSIVRWRGEKEVGSRQSQRDFLLKVINIFIDPSRITTFYSHRCSICAASIPRPRYLWPSCIILPLLHFYFFSHILLFFSFSGTNRSCSFFWRR